MMKRAIFVKIAIILLLSLLLMLCAACDDETDVIKENDDASKADEQSMADEQIEKPSEKGDESADKKDDKVELTIENGTLLSYNGKAAEVIVPDSVEQIGEKAFENCCTLTRIILPDSVKTIGSEACKNCENLLEIKIPDTVTKIGAAAFECCDSLSFEVVGGAKYIDKHLIAPETKEIETLTIKEGTKTIADKAFNECEKLSKIFVEDNDITSVGDLFDNCFNISEITGTVKDLAAFKGSKILDNIVVAKITAGEISRGTFSGYTKLANLTIGTGVTSVDAVALSELGSIKEVEMSAWHLHALPKDKCDRVKITDGEVADYAFANCTNLKSVELCDGVASIGGYAFSGCNNLSKIIIPQSVKSIGEFAFEFCKELTTISLPDGMTEISIGLFKECRKLKKVTLSEKTTKIGDSAFSRCTALCDIVLPNSIREIETYAFFMCSSLTEINMPNKLVTIGDEAFSGCTNLTSVILPNNVEGIGYSAFGDCEKLTIYAEQKSKPEGWNSEWNGCCTVEWNCGDKKESK